MDSSDIGKTALYKNIDDEKYELFLKLLSFEKGEFLNVLDTLTNKEVVLKLLDIFAGESIKFPNRKAFIWVLEKVSMYMYLKEHNFTQDAYYVVSKEYDKTVYEVKKIVAVIDKNLQVK